MKQTLMLILAIVATGAFAQSNGIPSDPVLAKKAVEARRLEYEGFEQVKAKSWESAIEAGKKSLLLSKEVNTWSGGKIHGWMAFSYLQLGQVSEASESFKEMTRLVDPVKSNEASPDIHIVENYSVLYIEFLAQQGRENDAKAVYYALMRWLLNPSLSLGSGSRLGQEPFPFLIVFDEDENGDYWPYTPERITLAAKLAVMSKAGKVLWDWDKLNYTKQPEIMEQAKSVFPGWYYPYAVEAANRAVWSGEADIEYALGFARNDRERGWIKHGVAWWASDSVERLESGFEHSIDCISERRKIKLLETSRVALMDDPSSVSCERWGSKY